MALRLWDHLSADARRMATRDAAIALKSSRASDFVLDVERWDGVRVTTDRRRRRGGQRFLSDLVDFRPLN
jgi:hypothetical protein